MTPQKAVLVSFSFNEECGRDYKIYSLFATLVTPCDPHILLHSFDRAMNHGWGVSALAAM